MVVQREALRYGIDPFVSNIEPTRVHFLYNARYGEYCAEKECLTCAHITVTVGQPSFSAAIVGYDLLRKTIVTISASTKPTTESQKLSVDWKPHLKVSLIK